MQNCHRRWEKTNGGYVVTSRDIVYVCGGRENTAAIYWFVESAIFMQPRKILRMFDVSFSKCWLPYL